MWKLREHSAGAGFLNNKLEFVQLRGTALLYLNEDNGIIISIRTLSTINNKDHPNT